MIKYIAAIALSLLPRLAAAEPSSIEECVEVYFSEIDESNDSLYNCMDDVERKLPYLEQQVNVIADYKSMVASLVVEIDLLYDEIQKDQSCTGAVSEALTRIRNIDIDSHVEAHIIEGAYPSVLLVPSYLATKDLLRSKLVNAKVDLQGFLCPYEKTPNLRWDEGRELPV